MFFVIKCYRTNTIRNLINSLFINEIDLYKINDNIKFILIIYYLKSNVQLNIHIISFNFINYDNIALRYLLIYFISVSSTYIKRIF